MAISNINAPAAGTPLPFDSVGSAQYPLAKLTFGAEGASVLVADANGARLPVQIGGTLPAFASTPAFTISGTLPDFATPPTVNIGTTAGLTNTQLRASPVSVSWSGQNVGITGLVTVTGPLTNAELRASAVPVSGTVTANAGTGTFAISAASLPLPTGAATAAAQTTGNNSLASIDAKLAALEGGRAPVAVQTLATTTRAYGYAAGQRLTTSGAGQVRSTAVAATEVLLHASIRGFFRVGNSAVEATVGAGSIPLEAGEKFHLRITSGDFISFIRDGSTDGSLTIMPVA